MVNSKWPDSLSNGLGSHKDINPKQLKLEMSPLPVIVNTVYLRHTVNYGLALLIMFIGSLKLISKDGHNAIMMSICNYIYHLFYCIFLFNTGAPSWLALVLTLTLNTSRINLLITYITNIVSNGLYTVVCHVTNRATLSNMLLVNTELV